MERADVSNGSLFPKSNRLLKAADFSNLRSDFKKKFSGPFMLVYKENTLSCSRLGIAVSKKSANSVHRNKIKRLVREAFRKHEVKKSNMDLLVIFNKSIKFKDNTSQNFSNNIQNLFSEVIS